MPVGSNLRASAVLRLLYVSATCPEISEYSSPGSSVIPKHDEHIVERGGDGDSTRTTSKVSIRSGDILQRRRGAGRGTYRCDAEADRLVVHAEDHDALVLGGVLSEAADVGLDDIAAVKEGHLAVAADPDLVARVLGDDGQGGDVESELPRAGELACRRHPPPLSAPGSGLKAS